MAFVNIHGNVTHYRDEGPRNGPPLVFINSLGTDFRIWDELAPEFARDCRVVRYDKRGHGLSGLPAGAASIADYARDLAGLLDALGLGRATIVGLSIGGLIAQELYGLIYADLTPGAQIDKAYLRYGWLSPVEEPPAGLPRPEDMAARAARAIGEDQAVWEGCGRGLTRGAHGYALIGRNEKGVQLFHQRLAEQVGYTGLRYC